MPSQQTGDNPRAVGTQQTGENLRAVRTQQTCVDPRAEIARSHLPDSVKTRGRSDNTQTGDDQARGTSRNMFNRLGKWVDMRNTLNRRQEQQHSQ